MDKGDKVFDGSIPEIYDTHMVPLIFDAYARGLADLVVREAPGEVLETAAGSGVVTRMLAPRLVPKARYTVTDLNGPMLARAQEQQPADARLDWRVADAMSLPFDAGRFDVVCCQFGAMFFPDKVAAHREVHRVLHPGGAWIFNVWDRIEENILADAVTRAAAEIFPDDPPVFMARTPHGYHACDQIEADLREVGFDDISITTVRDISRAENARRVAVAFCQGTPLRNEIEAREAGALRRVTDHAEARLIEAYGKGEIAGRMQAHVIVARA